MFSFFHFLKAALKNPLRVSTVFETGPSVAKILVSVVPENAQGLVVELGVGTGAVTEVLLEKLGPETSRYVGFELDQSMVNFVRKRFPNARFEVEPAETFTQHLGGQKVSAVISTLPWTLMPPETVTTILQGIKDNLPDNGGFATYVTGHVLKTPAGKRVQTAFAATFPNLKSEFITNNLPPARVFTVKGN